MSGIEEIKNKLETFKRKFYIRQSLLGALMFSIFFISLFLILNTVEYQFWLSKTIRTVLFFSFLIFSVSMLGLLIIKPLLQLSKVRKGISDEKAAEEIAKSFPELEDKLSNTLQLNRLSKEENTLLVAALDKKASDFRNISFIQAVDFKPIKKFSYILGSIIICFLIVSFINPSIIKDSSSRLVNFNKDFVPEAPFQFKILNNSLVGFKGEDFNLKIEISGKSIPDELFLVNEEGLRTKLRSENAENYSYLFKKLQSSKSFQLEGAGFFSNNYQISVNERPELISQLINVSEPSYTGGERKTITNTGDLTVLEGSRIEWNLSTLSTNHVLFLQGSDTLDVSQETTSQFIVADRIKSSSTYQISLFNEFGKNSSSLTYQIEVIQDTYPEIRVEYFPDSILYQFVTLAGSINDDYGFSSLYLNYRKEETQKFTSIPLEINAESISQSFYANWNIDTLALKSGKSLEFYLSVSDNDGINGAKTSKSKTFILQIPSQEKINNELDKKSKTVESQIDKSKTKAENINERLKNLEDKLKADQKYDWQEKKQFDDIIADREKLAEEIKQLQKQHQELKKSSKQFKDQSDQLQNKNEQLQKLLDELMDEETRELYEQLKKLMNEDSPSEQVTQQLDKLQQNEKNLEKELERALELFKRLKMESVLEQNLAKVDTLSNKQDEVANKNTDLSDPEKIKEQQKEIQEKFEEFREQMDKVQKLNQELKRPEPLEDFELEERQIAKELREIQEELNKESSESESNGEKDSSANSEQEQKSDSQKSDQNKKSQQKQKSAAQRMKSLSQKLSKMQSGMQMEMMQANLDQLRDILDNLVKLSFNQEDLMTEMRSVNQSDPRFLELSQAQLKLKDDAKVIQDSLLSLAEKVTQISSFITREVGLINENIDESVDYLKDRNRGRALSSQQFAMTSINNLALLLDDTMQQMQMSMSESMGQSKGDKKQQGLPDLQEMQNQLGEKMQEIQGSGKSGRQLSEELARMAAQQEMIRRQMEMLKEMQDGKPGGGLGGDEMKKAIDMMEQNEVDLVNKRLTQRLINRQKSIETRMLEAEKAQRQQETDEERESESPTIISTEIPPGFEEYLKLKQKEIELLKTIPLDLNPFYKKEVNDYFRRLSSDDKND